MTPSDSARTDLGSTPGAFRQALQPGTELDGGKYSLIRVLGEPGGFGITYLAHDLALDLEVAIKEYLPRELAARGRDGFMVEPDTPHNAELFQIGLETFVDEARRLARFEHPHIVGVRVFFRQHGTAYMVMQYYRGRNLNSYLQEEGGRVPEKRAVELILPVLDALCTVQAEGMIHRDVKPHNIYLTDDDRPILLDFGAARVTLGERSGNPTRLVSRGFAAPEQYVSDPAQEDDRQGPWTDVYGVGATLYRMTSGQQPPDALDRRLSQEPLKPLKALAPQLSPGFCSIVEQALSVPVRQRPQNAEAFRRLLRHAVGRRKASDDEVASDWDETPVRRRQPSPPVARELRPQQRPARRPPPPRATPQAPPAPSTPLILSAPTPDNSPSPPDLGELNPHTARHWQDDTTLSTTRPDLPTPGEHSDTANRTVPTSQAPRSTGFSSGRWGAGASVAYLREALSRRRLLTGLVVLVLAAAGLVVAYDYWLPRPPGLYLKLRVAYLGPDQHLSRSMVRVVNGPHGPPPAADLLPELEEVCTIDAVWGGQRITLDDLTFDCP